MPDPIAIEPPPANMPNGHGLPPLSDEPLPIRFAKACLLLHRGGPWTKEDHDTWARLTGTWLCTTRNLCDMARRVLEADHGS